MKQKSTQSTDLPQTAVRPKPAEPELRTEDYISIRFYEMERDWLFALAERETMDHKANCLCIGCNSRRKLDKKSGPGD